MPGWVVGGQIEEKKREGRCNGSGQQHNPAGWLGWCLFCYTLTRLGGSCGLCASWKANLMKVFQQTVWWGPPRSGKRENCATGCKLRRRRWKIKINRLGKEEVMKCPRDSVAFFWYDLIFVPILKLCWGKTCNYYHMESLLFQRSNLFF